MIPFMLRRERLARPLLEAAVFTVLAMVAAGSLLVVAAKLQYPSFGSGGSTIEALTVAVIAGLGSLGVPLHLGELTASALPLGALALIGWAAVWGTAHRLADSEPATLLQRVHTGLNLGLWLAPICLFLSLAFRIRGTSPVYADAWWSFFLGGLWGAFFGAVGGLASVSSLGGSWARAVRHITGSGRGQAAGFRIAAVMLWSAAVLGAGGLLLGAIASLLSGHPASGFGVSDVVAAVTYAALFGPNMIVAVVALGFGSSISIGAQISTSGRALGPSVEYSLVEWQPHGPPAVAFALLLLPLLSTLVAGYRARDTTVARADLIAGLRWAAPAVSLALFVWAAIAEARIGGDLLGTRGFARLAPDPWVLAFVTILWTAGGVWLGWSIADRALRDRSPLGGTA